jgi:hypothetical protein
MLIKCCRGATGRLATHVFTPFTTVFYILLLSSSLAAAQTESFQLSAPIACSIGQDCIVQNYVDHGSSLAPGDPGAMGEVHDYHCGALSYRGHNGTDFRIPDIRAQRTGVDVLAAAEGQAQRVRDEIPDLGAAGMAAARAQGRECGNGVVIAHANGWQTQYCHLALGSLRVKSGDHVRSGQPLGRVGLSGNTEFPHVHLTVRHNGHVVDPFAYGAQPGSCDGGVSLWEPSLQSALRYRERTVFNVGFATTSAITMEAIESGELTPPRLSEDAAILSAYVRTVGLRAGDVQRLRISAPDHRTIASHTAQPFDRNKAQVMLFVGAKRPPTGWPAGRYVADYSVSHDGQVVAERQFAIEF